MTNDTKNDCKFCGGEGLKILPLRYGAVCSENEAWLKELSSLPQQLGDFVTSIPLSTQARYSARLIRPGYIYVWVVPERGVGFWQAYQAQVGGYLYNFSSDLNNPPGDETAFSCDPGTHGVNASMVTIAKPETVSQTYWLFTPSPLTQAKRDEYKANAKACVARGMMQSFSPKAWVSGQDRKQLHTMPISEGWDAVADFKLYQLPGHNIQKPLAQLMGSQMFPSIEEAFTGSNGDKFSGRFTGMRLAMQKGNEPCLVLHDAIGITQELNNFRNDAMESIQRYLVTKDSRGFSNQFKVDLSETIADIKIGWNHRIIQDSAQALGANAVEREKNNAAQLQRAAELRKQNQVNEAKVIEKAVAHSTTAGARNDRETRQLSKTYFEELWARKYETHLDVAEIDTFRKQASSFVNEANAAASRRAPDHLKWFKSAQLVDAFHAYDSSDTASKNRQYHSAYNFALHSAICTAGIGACEAYDDQIYAWVTAPAVDRRNIYMRGIYYNQSTLVKAAGEAYPQLKGLADGDSPLSEASHVNVMRAIKGLVSGFKSVDSAFDEWARSQGQDFSRKWVQPNTGPIGKLAGKLAPATGQFGIEIQIFAKMSEWTRLISRSAIGGKPDRLLLAVFGGVQYAMLRGAAASLLRHGDVTSKLPNWDDLMVKLTPDELKEFKRVTKNITAGNFEKALTEVMEDAKAKSGLRQKLSNIAGAKPGDLGTNNYHHARIGVLLLFMEGYAIWDKWIHFKKGDSWSELAGSALSITSVALDTCYSLSKALREIPPYVNGAVTSPVAHINRAADVVRGGFKIGAAGFGTLAGGISVFTDFSKAEKNAGVDNTLATIYFLRGWVGVFSTGLSARLAFSYAESLLLFAGKRTATEEGLKGAVKLAEELAKRRVSMLVWAARFNVAGLALTVGELVYVAYIETDALEDWLKRSVFRKNKTTAWYRTDPHISQDEEMKALEKALQKIGLLASPESAKK